MNKKRREEGNERQPGKYTITRFREGRVRNIVKQDFLFNIVLQYFFLTVIRPLLYFALLKSQLQ